MKHASLAPTLPPHGARGTTSRHDNGNAAVGSGPLIDALVGMVLAERHLRPYRAALRDARPALSTQAETRALLAERLKAEADRHWAIDPHISLRLARAIILLGRLGSDQGIVALGTMARADALRLLGEPRFALLLLGRAATLFQASGDEVGWARTRISAMSVHISLGLLYEALEAANEARAIFLRHQDRSRLARLDLNAAFVYDRLGQRDVAMQLWDAVIGACADTAIPGAVDLSSTARLNRAMTLHRLGRLTDALESLREVRSHFAAANQTRGIANADWLIGLVSLFQGRYGPALRAFEDARLAFEALDMPIDAARVGGDILECYLAIGRPDRVQVLGGMYASAVERSGLTLEAVEVALHQAEAMRRLGQPDLSLTILDAVEGRLSDQGLDVWQARCLHGRAQALLAQGTSEALDAAYTVLARALTIFEGHGLPVETAQTLLLQARVEQAAGLAAEARINAERVLAAALELGLAGLTVGAYTLLASLASGAGNLTDAADNYARAIAVLEQMQQCMTLDLRSSFLAADPATIFAAAITVALRRDRAEDVFTLVQRAKARALLDHVDGGIDLRPRDLDQVGLDLLADLRATREQYQLYCAALTSRRSEQESSLLPDLHTDDLPLEVRRCEEHMRELIESLHLRNPAYDEQAVLRGVGMIDPRPYLEPGHLFLNYYAIDDDLLIVLLEDGAAAAVLLPGAWSAVCGDIGSLHLNFESVAAVMQTGMDLSRLEARARGILRRIWDRLLAPVVGALERATRVTIAPFGRLHYLPFQALHDGDRYLIERLPVAIAPSASTFAALCRRADRRQGAGQGARKHPASALLVGMTMNGRLASVAEEVHAISRHLRGQVLLDKDATSEAVLALAEHASVLHLATHGAVRLDDSLFSFVQLADHPLTTADILSTKLSASLVTLSACETGLGHVGGGDDLAGLGRAFLYAGADALILSLWRVEDRSTAGLMEILYAEMASGRAKDEALRLAQLSILRAAGGVTGRSTSHPFFWAPFVLVGDSRPIRLP